MFSQPTVGYTIYEVIVWEAHFMEKIRKTAISCIHYILVATLSFTAFVLASRFFQPITRLRFRLWVWKIVVVIICIDIVLGLIQFILKLSKNSYRVITLISVIALAILAKPVREEALFAGEFFFKSFEETVAMRDGKKYVIERERMDDTYLRFYPYKNGLFSGLIEIQEHLSGDGTITYYDEHGWKIKEINCMNPEDEKMMWLFTPEIYETLEFH